MLDSLGRQVDIHPVVFHERGDGVYRMRNGEDWVYPSCGFAGKGRVLDLWVRCLSPEVQVLCHTGYELDEDDFRDMHALHERFGVGAPSAGSGP